MGKIRSKKEKRLQRKLIPLNIVVCVISLVAALTLFLTPILKINVGKILQDEATENYVEDLAEGFIPANEGEGLDYKPVLVEIVKNIIGNAEGFITISASDALGVLTAGENKGEKVLDELLFNDKALATKLINSLVDGISDVIESDKGKDAIEKALMNTLSSQIIDSVEDEKLKSVLEKNSDELNKILKQLGDPKKAQADCGAAVAEEYVEKLDELLGPDTNITAEEKQEFIKSVTDMYKDTQANLKEGENVSLEAIICVTVSNQFDLNKLDLGNLFGDKKKDGDGEPSPAKKAVDEELTGEDPDTEPGTDPGNDPNEDPAEEKPSKSPEEIATSYDELLGLMGFNKEAKDNLKKDMRTSFHDWLNGKIEEKNIDKYLAYYGYLFYGMLAFIVPWLVLFLFSFLHIFAGNKRFMTWYVKLICWIPSLIWLGIKLFPWIGGKFGLLDGDSGRIIKVALKGVTSFTWINGLCYVLLWLVMIFWAFPIKHKIRKLRKNGDDGDYEEAESYEEY